MLGVFQFINLLVYCRITTLPRQCRAAVSETSAATGFSQSKVVLIRQWSSSTTGRLASTGCLATTTRYLAATPHTHYTFSTPPCAIIAREPVFNKFGVELLDICIDAPVLSVDDQFYEVSLGTGNLSAAGVRIEHLTHEGRITRAVDEIERLVAHQTLAFDGVINLNIERFLL